MTESASPTDGLVTRQLVISGISIDVFAPVNDNYFNAISGDPEKFEPAVSVAKVVLGPNAVALDLGACLGTVSASIATLVPGGQVICVEPSRNMQPGLRATCANAAGGPVEVVHAAIGRTEGTLSYVTDPGGGAWGYVSEHGDYEIPVVSVDQLVTARNLQRVDLIKVDVEGFELNALQGAEATVARFSPVLVLELNPFCLWRFGRAMPQDVMTWITEHYRHVWAIDDTGTITALATEAEVNHMLWQLGTFGGLLDIVASQSVIDFPQPFRPSTPATAAVSSTASPDEEGVPVGTRLLDTPFPTLRTTYRKLPEPLRRAVAIGRARLRPFLSTARSRIRP